MGVRTHCFPCCENSTWISVLMMLANAQGQTKGKPTDLRSTKYLPDGQLYPMMIGYAQSLFPHITIVHDLSPDPGVTLISKTCAYTLPYVQVEGLRYSSVTNKRTSKDRFAFISRGSTKTPCHIQWIFDLRVPGQPSHLCAGIQTFRTDNRIPTFPWDT